MKKDLVSLVCSLFMSTSGCVNRNILPVETNLVGEIATNEHVALYTQDSQTYRHIIDAEYVPEQGFIPTPSATVVDYLWLAETNLALLHFDTAERLVKEGKQQGQISQKDYLRFNETLDHQKEIQHIVLESLQPSKEWEWKGDDWFLYVGNLCVKKETPADILGGDHELYMLWKSSSDIKAGNKEGYLERARQIYVYGWHTTSLFPLALSDLETFIQSTEPSDQLARAYDTKAYIHRELGEKREEHKARQEVKALEKQGYTPYSNLYFLFE